MIKSQNPYIKCVSNHGKKWTDEEEYILLKELQQNIDIDTISKNHGRTSYAIVECRKRLAYRMFLKNIPINEIMNNANLNEEQVREIIEKEYYMKKITKSKPIVSTNSFSLESEIIEMKKEIIELKSTIKELVEMMKAVYEFEDA